MNPALGRRQFSLVSEAQESEIGRQAHEQIIQAMPVYDDAELQSYVDTIGRKLSQVSERPDIAWTFTLLDDPTVNAFALPGGYVYVTRGILDHMTTEAQAAAVIGHEIGHVTGRHAASQMSKAQLAGVGLAIGSVISPVFRQYGQIAQAGAQLMFLKFSRDHEREADDLGLRYASRAGYSAEEAVQVFRMLEQQSARASDGRLPDWLSTHPNPGSRVERVQAAVAERYAGDAPAAVDRERFLQVLDGTVFGEDPANGYFVDNAFYHPSMRFQLDLPPGWHTTNSPQAVAAVSPNRDAAIVLAATSKLSAAQAAKELFSQPGVRATASDATSINGLPATLVRFQAQAEDGVVDGIASFIDYDGIAYAIVAYTAAGRLGAYAPVFQTTISSFAPLRDPRRLDVQPMRIRTVRVPRAMTLAEFRAAYPSSVDEETLALINHLAAGEMLEGGQLYKTVAGGIAPD